MRNGKAKKWKPLYWALGLGMAKNWKLRTFLWRFGRYGLGFRVQGLLHGSMSPGELGKRKKESGFVGEKKRVYTAEMASRA